MFRGSGGSLKPSLYEPKSDQAPYELYNIEADPGETHNLYFDQPQVVNQLTEEITSIILNGRSTPGTPQDYVKTDWEQLTWIK
jgi:arylsulfatase A